MPCLLNDTLVSDVSSVWRDYVEGNAGAAITINRLQSEFDYHVPASSFPSPTPSPSTASSDSAADPPANPAPTPALPAQDGVADGDKVGKSAKTIKVEFKVSDTAIAHLSKEQAFLMEVDLLYPTVNAATKINMVVSHCDHHVKGIAVTTRNSSLTPFTSVEAFLTSFRLNRYPSFHNDCRIALESMKQTPRESIYHTPP